MAYFTKDEYFRKELYAAGHLNKQHDLAIANGMTEEQYEALCELCSLRHKMHCGCEAITSDDPDATIIDFMTNERDSEAIYTEEHPIYSLLGRLPFAPMDSITGWHRPGDWYDCLTDEDKELFIEDECDGDANQAPGMFKAWCYAKNGDEIRRIDSEILEYLGEIDAKYGTEFRPTGKTRILN